MTEGTAIRSKCGCSPNYARALPLRVNLQATRAIADAIELVKELLSDDPEVLDLQERLGTFLAPETSFMTYRCHWCKQILPLTPESVHLNPQESDARPS